MSDTAVDSSVVAKWFLPEPDSAQAQRLITDVANKGFRLVTLDLALSESTIWKRYHRGLATLDEARHFLGQLLATPVHVESSIPLLPLALEISMKYNQAIYDGLFVALCNPKDCRASQLTSLCISLCTWIFLRLYSCATGHKRFN